MTFMAIFDIKMFLFMLKTNIDDVIEKRERSGGRKTCFEKTLKIDLSNFYQRKYTCIF